MGKGGHRQRRAVEQMVDAAEDNEAGAGHHEQGESALERTLLEKWLWGKVSGVCVQEIAQSACLDGARHSADLAIARLGAHGTCPNHVHKDLMTRYANNVLMPPIDAIIAPVVNPREPTTIVQFAVPTLLFHKWVSHLSTNYPDDYQRIFGIARRRAFWDAVSESSP